MTSLAQLEPYSTFIYFIILCLYFRLNYYVKLFILIKRPIEHQVINFVLKVKIIILLRGIFMKLI